MRGGPGFRTWSGFGLTFGSKIFGYVEAYTASAGACVRACAVRVLKRMFSSCSMEEFGPEGRAKRVGMLDRCEVPLFWCGDRLWAVGFHCYLTSQQYGAVFPARGGIVLFRASRAGEPHVLAIP